MTALILNPNPFTITSSTGANAKYLLNDEIGLIWRTSSTTASLVVELDGSEIDAVALAGTSLVHGDNVRIRLGNSLAEVNGTATIDMTVSIANGAPMSGTSFVIATLSEPDAFTFLRIDISATFNVDVSRLIIGKSVNCDGVDVGAEITYSNDTQSSLDPLKTKPMWKASVSGFTEAAKFTIWHPLLMDLGDQHGFLFVPFLEGDYVQQQAVFGYMSGQSKGTASNSDYWVIDLQITSLI